MGQSKKDLLLARDPYRYYHWHYYCVLRINYYVLRISNSVLLFSIIIAYLCLFILSYFVLFYLVYAILSIHLLSVFALVYFVCFIC